MGRCCYDDVMHDLTAPGGSRWRTTGALVACALIGVSGCAAEPCECPPVSCPEASAASAPTGPHAPRAALALDALGKLFARDFAPVRALLTHELREELTEDKLAAIVGGLVQAHGEPARVVDAWTSTITEKQEVMPAAEVLVRMGNDTRVGLLLVFDAHGAVKGLWLRPI